VLLVIGSATLVQLMSGMYVCLTLFKESSSYLYNSLMQWYEKFLNFAATGDEDSVSRSLEKRKGFTIGYMSVNKKINR